MIVGVTLPSGDPVWVSVASSGLEDSPGDARGTQDVGLRGSEAAVIQAGQLSGFTETVRGVMTSVREALDTHGPNALTVEFGLEISVRTGKVLSVLAEGGGTAHIKVTATWQEKAAGPVTGALEGG